MRAVRIGLLISALVWSLAANAVDAPLTVGIRGHLVQHDLFSIMAAPGENLQLDLPGSDTRNLRLYLDGRPHGRAGNGQWSFTAPEQPGMYQLELARAGTASRTRLNLFVGVPASAIDGESLNGYRLGPAPPGRSDYRSYYRAPDRFIEVTEENVDTHLTPHFTLRQFLCKQESPYPKYVAINESLLVLLENLLQAVNQAGYPVETFGVISGYRTPDYNRRIGNVPNSRHVYGDAMDLFVDEDGDGNMDDLNGDGERNRADVDLLYRIIEQVKDRPENAALTGGVGRYYQASHHGGFVHVDARGFRARW